MARSNVLTAHTQAPSCSIALPPYKRDLLWQNMSASHHNVMCCWWVGSLKHIQHECQ